ncbi:class I SAM-dependent methyltransferase [Sphingomonas bacterium]|uniref:class I SAM-dependent methyltransferase n=1 Tax=Sphingomonas bacterium TaxID=1895847 RepID=UPI0015766DB3|nr:class I SAM-dependent methyltransferase [Sphingomonas bacterium]
MATSAIVRLKSAVKESLIRNGGERLVVLFWKLRGKDVSYLASGTRAERFKQIYRDGVWIIHDSDAPLSGLGSSLSATEALRSSLPVLLSDLDVRTLVDVGCGDFTWMSHTSLALDRYTGIDIVPEVIEANKISHASANRSFIVMDVCETIPPMADAILCREVLFHLSFKDADRALRNIRQSGAVFLLASSDPKIARNTDIPSGDFRDINLSIAPYSLGQPIQSIPETGGPNRNRLLAVWRLAEII